MTVGTQPSGVAQAPAKSKSKRKAHGGNTAAGGPSTPVSANAATYPPSFTTTFITRCLARGSGQLLCTCEVNSIEDAVNYTTFRAALQNLATGHAPAWYQTALRPCTTAAAG